MLTEAIEVTLEGGARLLVQFIERGDRLGHLISLATTDGEKVRLLESVEGAADEDWPPSPPLQNVSFETLSDSRRVALLVGMAGGSHWSASVEPVPERRGLLFDVACRHRASAAWRGSVYQVHAGPGLAAEVGGDIQIEAVSGRLRLAPHGPSAGPGTTRWSYFIGTRATDYGAR